MSTYSEKLLDPRWQKRKTEIQTRDKFTCQRCGNTDKTQHVHHMLYRKNTEPWDYADGELFLLCEDCHSLCHELKDRLGEVLATLRPRQYIHVLAALVSSSWDHCDPYQTLHIASMHALRLKVGRALTDVGATDEVNGTAILAIPLEVKGA